MRHTILSMAGLVLLLSLRGSFADTIKLEGGGSVKGQIIESKSTADSVVVKLQIGGGEVTIERAKIQEIVFERNTLAEYEAIKEQYGDTAEDQFKLAMWCEANKLSRQRREHLLKAIELDPDHAGAREKLGYVLRDGKWLTARELKESNGLVRFNGRYVTPQEKEILEQKKREDEETKEWFSKVRMWKTWLTANDPAKAREAEELLRTIEDPLAIEPILMHFGKEQSESLRVLMCDLLANIPGERATLELVRRSIADVSTTVRWAAIDKLVERDDPTAVRSLIHVLTSEHNVLVRRAAEALGAIGDPTAVQPLIEALVTKHKQIVTKGVQGSFMGNATPTIVDYEPVVAQGVVAYRPVIGYQAQGIGIGSTQQEVVVVPVENLEVHHALVSITEEDFGYNQVAWRQWLVQQKRKNEPNRRQPGK